MHIPRIPKEAVRGGGGGGGGPFLNYNDIRVTRHNVIWHGFNLRDMEHPQTRITFGTRSNPDFTGFLPSPPWDSRGLIPHYHFFRNNNQKIHGNPTNQPWKDLST